MQNVSSERFNEISGMLASKLLGRFSQDKRNVDNYGKLLLELCKASGMLILNGRLGDAKGIGRCTRLGDNSSSVVDYVISTPSYLTALKTFGLIVNFQNLTTYRYHLP